MRQKTKKPRESAVQTIDSDGHVIETPKTWSYLRDEEREFHPQIFVRDPNDGAGTQPRQQNDYWIIGGKLVTKSNVGKDVPAEARDMEDIRRRLAHMDQIGIDVQVLYPTIFLRPVTNEPDVEFALARSYNRWLADIWKQSDNRLRWAAVPPLLSLVDRGKVRAELEFCKANGACAIFMRGMECERLINHRYFFPLYEMAQELDLAITLHAGVGSYAYHDGLPRTAALMIFKFPILGAFNAILEDELPKRFPGVRWAFVEASAQWVPYVLGEAQLRLNRRGRRASDDLLGDSNFYITTQRTDDLNWLLSEIGDGNLVIGTDYGHRDSATEIDALKRLGEDGSYPAASVKKILQDNPMRLFAIA
jgi:predicted TIM-barrel fold metal-dependent hydrolase